MLACVVLKPALRRLGEDGGGEGLTVLGRAQRCEAAQLKLRVLLVSKRGRIVRVKSRRGSVKSRSQGDASEQFVYVAAASKSGGLCGGEDEAAKKVRVNLSCTRQSAARE